MKIGHKIQDERERSQIISKAINKVAARHKGETIMNRQMVEEVSAEVSLAIAKYMVRNNLDFKN